MVYERGVNIFNLYENTALKGLGRPRDSSCAKKIADVCHLHSHTLFINIASNRSWPRRMTPVVMNSYFAPVFRWRSRLSINRRCTLL